MEQLLLDLATPSPATRGNFVVGPNALACAAIDEALAGRAREPRIFLWGGAGCGKTHLLEACARALPGAVYVACSPSTRPAPEWLEAPLLAFDDVHRLDPDGEAALFDLHNRLQGSATVLLASARNAPAFLPLRRDLATRLAWGLVFELRSLTEPDIAAAFQTRLRERGVRLTDEVMHFMLTRFQRDLRSIETVFAAIERLAFETRRPLTLPLVRAAVERSGRRADGQD